MRLEFCAKSEEEADLLEWIVTRLEAVFWLQEIWYTPPLPPYTLGLPNVNDKKEGSV